MNAASGESTVGAPGTISFDNRRNGFAAYGTPTKSGNPPSFLPRLRVVFIVNTCHADGRNGHRPGLMGAYE